MRPVVCHNVKFVQAQRDLVSLLRLRDSMQQQPDFGWSKLPADVLAGPVLSRLGMDWRNVPPTHVPSVQEMLLQLEHAERAQAQNFNFQHATQQAAADSLFAPAAETRVLTESAEMPMTAEAGGSPTTADGGRTGSEASGIGAVSASYSEVVHQAQARQDSSEPDINGKGRKMQRWVAIVVQMVASCQMHCQFHQNHSPLSGSDKVLVTIKHLFFSHLALALRIRSASSLYTTPF